MCKSMQALTILFIWPLRLLVSWEDLIFLAVSSIMKKNKETAEHFPAKLHNSGANFLQLILQNQKSSNPNLKSNIFSLSYNQPCSCLVWDWQSLSLPSTHSINIAPDRWESSLWLHHYSHCLSAVCMTVLVLLSVAVCAQLSVCLSSFLDTCCISLI